jgi:hypothetical protein
MFAHADLNVSDDSDDDSKDYHLIVPTEINIKNNRGIALPFTMPRQRIQVHYYRDLTFYISPYISENSHGYEDNIIPSLFEMVNSVFASQVKYLLEDIDQEINNKSYLKLRLYFYVLKSFSKMAIFSLSVYFSINYLLGDPDKMSVIRKMMKDAVISLEDTCSETFSVTNNTCHILSNDPPICTINPDNCPVTDCTDVTNLLNICKYLSPSLGDNTHDLIKYSTNFYERLKDCNGTAWHDYLHACSDYENYFKVIPLEMFAFVLILFFTPLIFFYLCVHPCQYNMDSARREERERVLNTKFKNLFDRDILQDNVTYRALLQLEDEDENVSVRQVVDKLNQMNMVIITLRRDFFVRIMNLGLKL